MSLLKFLLLPFAILYDVIMDMRNRLYDMQFKPSTRFDVPVICVGNLVMGGTGKTPMVEYLIRFLLPSNKVATLSRGYGRKTKGFRIAGGDDTARTVGDEPYQIYKKFSPAVKVTVGEDRALAIPTILQEFEEIDSIILDDGFQHRRVIPGLSILLTEFDRPFFDDHVLPFGRLREGPEGAKRADAIVVTKCPVPLESEELMRIERGVRKYSSKPIFFSRIRYGEPKSFGNKTATLSRNVILLSGIANAFQLEEYVGKNFSIVKNFAFPDHYPYKVSDLVEIEAVLEKSRGMEVCILTTEKDMVKLDRVELKSHISKLPIFYLPIEAEFIRNGKDFDALVLSFMNSFKRE